MIVTRTPALLRLLTVARPANPAPTMTTCGHAAFLSSRRVAGVSGLVHCRLRAPGRRAGFAGTRGTARIGGSARRAQRPRPLAPGEDYVDLRAVQGDLRLHVDPAEQAEHQAERPVQRRGAVQLVGDHVAADHLQHLPDQRRERRADPQVAPADLGNVASRNASQNTPRFSTRDIAPRRQARQSRSASARRRRPRRTGRWSRPGRSRR